MDENTPVVTSVAKVAARFFAELSTAIPVWQSRLQENPDDLEQIEQEVHMLTTRGADMVASGLLSIALQDPSPEQKREQSQAKYSSAGAE